MATTKSRYWIPTTSYDLQLKIGKIDYTADVERLTIISSILMPYQTFVIELFLDPNDLILDRVYGQEKIELTVRLIGVDEIIQEEVPIELMFVSNKQPIMMKSRNSQEDMKDRKPVVITTVSRKAFSTMYSIVNGLYFGDTVDTAISGSVTQIPGSPTLNIDSDGLNQEVIDQMVVPPATFYHVVQYLDQTFGIYDGILSVNCLYDNNIFIKNLSKKIQTSHLFTLHLLSADANEKELTEKPIDGKSFYTWRDIHTEYIANAVLGVVGAKQRHIAKPNAELYKNFDITVPSIAQQYGISSKVGQPTIYNDQDAMGLTGSGGRIGVFGDRTYYNDSETPIRARVSRITSEFSSLKVQMTSKSISILNLMHVGEAVKFNTKIIDYTQLTGKYILKSSTIKFARLREWEANVSLDLIRSNRSTN